MYICYWRMFEEERSSVVNSTAYVVGMPLVVANHEAHLIINSILYYIR